MYRTWDWSSVVYFVSACCFNWKTDVNYRELEVDYLEIGDNCVGLPSWPQERVEVWGRSNGVLLHSVRPQKEWLHFTFVIVFYWLRLFIKKYFLVCICTFIFKTFLYFIFLIFVFLTYNLAGICQGLWGDPCGLRENTVDVICSGSEGVPKYGLVAQGDTEGRGQQPVESSLCLEINFFLFIITKWFHTVGVWVAGGGKKKKHIVSTTKHPLTWSDWCGRLIRFPSGWTKMYMGHMLTLYKHILKENTVTLNEYRSPLHN